MRNSEKRYSLGAPRRRSRQAAAEALPQREFVLVDGALVVEFLQAATPPAAARTAELLSLLSRRWHQRHSW